MNSLTSNQKALLALVKGSLWECTEKLPEADWDQVESLAADQGVLWMLYFGAKRHPQSIDKDRIRTWRGAMYSGILNNERINSEQEVLVRWLEERNIRAAILKGTSCSCYYPYPDARSLGDIDVLVEKENLQSISKHLEGLGYRQLNTDHGFHVEFHGNDVVIEIHYALTDVPQSPGGEVVASLVPRLLDDINFVTVNSVKVPTLSHSNQALMLLLHMERHMLSGELVLRQLCDWATFVDGSPEDHWDNRTTNLLKNCGLWVYAQVLTKTCIRYLGLGADKASWCKDVPDELTDEMICEMFRDGQRQNCDTGYVGNLFTDRDKLGQKKHSKVQDLIAYLNKVVYINWPLAQKVRILLPVGWAYFPLRYLLRSLIGLRPKKDVLSTLGFANQHDRFYRSLHLYEIDN